MPELCLLRSRTARAVGLGLALFGAGACRLRPHTWFAPGRLESGVSSKCINNYSVMDGPYRYENNQWGAGKSRGLYEQCLLSRDVDGRTERGWSWNFPGFDSSVFSYPEIIYGWKPWSGGKSTDPRFPMRVADVHTIAVHYAVESQITGGFNLAPEIWLMNRMIQSEAPAPSLITAEIMFWLDSGGGAQPGGRIVSHASIDGSDWEVWRADNAGNKGNGQGWLLVSFKSPQPKLSGTLNVHEFLKYLVAAHLVDPAHTVAGVEFGNEVSGGKGTTWIKRFEVEVR